MMARVDTHREGRSWCAQRYEWLFAVVVAAAVFVPGLWRYSLTDLWETHYSEVAREMLEYDDFVHTHWRGRYLGDLNENEGFRSKPALIFWMMAAGLRAVGVAENGGYSGELVESSRTMLGIRLPFALAAIAGLAVMWWMLSRLVSRRMAWLGLLVVGSMPMFCILSRTAMADMPLTACMIGAVSLLLMALEDGDRTVSLLARSTRLRISIDARHVVVAVVAGAVLVQAVYYGIYFSTRPAVGPSRLPDPALLLPLAMLLLLVSISRDGWAVLRLPFLLVGAVFAAFASKERPHRQHGQGAWRHVIHNVIPNWERRDPLRCALCCIVFVFALPFTRPTGPHSRIRRAWRVSTAVAERALGMAPMTTMRQVYLLAMYFLLAVSVLAKGPPAVVIVAGLVVLYTTLCGRWRDVYEGRYELKRGAIVLVVVALPWHVAMYLREGYAFVDEYLFLHILSRASSGIENAGNTFGFYISQIGFGMWLWAALLPGAIVSALQRRRPDTREERVRFVITLWALSAAALYFLVSTKFRYYIFPALPPLGLLVAFVLHDLSAGRERLHPVVAAVAIGIVLLICRDLMHGPERWINMVVYGKRSWPSEPPWSVDVSDGFLALGVIAAIALFVATTKFVRAGLALIATAGLAISVWLLQVYMPLAGRHWGMRDAVRTYYEHRAIYGQKLLYFDYAQLSEDWRDVRDTWHFKTFVPNTVKLGQPMYITLRVYASEQQDTLEREVLVLGFVTAIGDHDIRLTLPVSERAKVQPLIVTAGTSPRTRARRGPIRFVDADKLVPWKMYWFGENFWSNGEIWGETLELKTAFPNPEPGNVEFQQYLADPLRTPRGRRYFILTTAFHAPSVPTLLPTVRSQQSYRVLDRTNNKYVLSVFEM